MFSLQPFQIKKNSKVFHIADGSFQHRGEARLKTTQD